MAEPPSIVVHPYHGPGLVEALADAGVPGVVVPADADGVVAAVESGAEGLVTYRWEDRFAAGALRWVQAISAGIDQFPLALLAERRIVLTSARGAHSPAVAEHAVALMMALVRGVGPSVRRAADRVWQPAAAYEVSGRTLGVLGLGSIGEEIARTAAALGMRVVGTKRSPGAYGGVAEAVFGPDGTTEVCRQADIVVIALPHDPTTAGLVGAAELAALGPGWIVNVGRGSVLDEAALIRALDDGELRGAGLDVTAAEPLPAESPLWDHPAVIVTPHMGWSTDRLSGRLATIVAANAAALRGEGEWVNRVVSQR